MGVITCIYHVHFIFFLRFLSSQKHVVFCISFRRVWFLMLNRPKFVTFRLSTAGVRRGAIPLIAGGRSPAPSLQTRLCPHHTQPTEPHITLTSLGGRPREQSP